MSQLLWQRWDEIDRLLLAALDLPPDERGEFLRREAGADSAFRDLLLRLLRRLEPDGAAINPPESLVESVFGAGEADESDLAPGTLVGRYRITGRRARGGMATVYEAERSDGAYQQRVALKVLRRGLDTDDLIQRFLTERQILSSLSHPNIANLLDGGSTPDGRPFLVMELVEGSPITSYADQRRLDIPGRLRLFLGVADAVHAAHRQLVVHRDIKPSNVLVDDDGRVTLLDFGIAKLLDQDREHSRAGVRALTPEYASPEQLRGGQITTATDVYQLGLLLHELLTGVRAAPDSAGPHESPARFTRPASRAVLAIGGAEGRAAARHTAPERLARRLRGDLDIIVAKALRPQPEERYASADELAADVRRHLRRLPILAHRESAVYRARRWMQRHAWAAGALAVGLVSLIGYAITITLQSRRIASERDRAALEARKAGQVTDFLLHLFDASDPNRKSGPETTASDLLEQGAQRLNAQAVEDPATRAAMLAAIGRSYSRLGLYAQAEQFLERAVATQRQTPPDETLARNLNYLAAVVELRDRDSARGLYREAVTIGERALGPHHPTVASLLLGYAVALSHEEPGTPQTRDLLERAVTILRAAPGEVREDLAQALLTSSYGREPDFSLPRMQEALALLRDVHGERHTAVAAALSDLALATEPVDLLAADSLMEQSLEILISIHGRRHHTLLTAMSNLAALRRDRGAFAEAEPLYREVLALSRDLYPEQRLGQAYALYGLGRVLVETGEVDEGEMRLREALAILELEGPPPLVALTRVAIGQALTLRARFADAERILLPATEDVLNSPVSPIDKARALQRVVELYQRWDRRERSEAFQQRLDSLINADRLQDAFPGRTGASTGGSMSNE